MTPIMLQEYEISEYKQLIEHIMINENITFDMDTLLQYNNLSPYLIFNLFNKYKYNYFNIYKSMEKLNFFILCGGSGSRLWHEY